MKKYLLLTLLFLLLNQVSYSQTYTIEADTGLQCHFVSINVSASGFPDSLGSLSLYFDFDPLKLQYISSTVAVPGLGVSQYSASRIAMIWFANDAQEGDTIDGLLTTIIFHYDGSTAILDFDEAASETFSVLDLLNPVPCSYVNGSVTEGNYIFNTYYVDAARPFSGNGKSWGEAFKTITEAANLSLKPGEQILIRPGIYYEKVTIKSEGGYGVLPKTGVMLSDTNKITFPSGANLSCVDLASYPGQYYAYIYRSWNSNNGYYKVTEVNDAQDYIRVSGASFIPETGAANNRGKVMAAVGRPVVYKKDPDALESQRVVVNSSGLGAIADAFYIGKPGANPQTQADSCNWNIIEGIDITAGTNTNSIKGLHIQSSGYNVFAKGKIYSLNGIGVIITGQYTSTYTSYKFAKYNIIQNNEIYNTPYQGVLLGYTNYQSSLNYSRYNHVIDNNFYLSGTGTQARFDNAVKVQYNNKSNVVEGNNFHDLSLYTAGNGALMIESKADSALAYNNIFKNIGKVNNGVHASIMICDSSSKVNVFNNIIYSDDTVTNTVYAFRIQGRKHAESKVAFNTINKMHNGFYLEDNSASTIDFGIHDNITSVTGTYFTETGTMGRFTVTYNLFYSAPAGSYGAGTGNIAGNPQFIDPNGPSMYGLMLMPSSPCFDTGIVVTNITRDYLGKIRDAAEPTLGAFEGLMECTWTGTTSTNWHTYQNWALQIVPQNFMSVIIPNTISDPVISTGHATCRSLNMLNGASLRVQSPWTLTMDN